MPPSEIYSEICNEYVYSIHREEGVGPIGTSEYVLVKPLSESDESWIIQRRFFFDEQSEREEKQFGGKVCSSASFRRASRNGEADWCHIQRIYENLDHEVRAQLRELDNLELDDVHEEMKGAFEEIRCLVKESDRKHVDLSDLDSGIREIIVVNKI